MLRGLGATAALMPLGAAGCSVVAGVPEPALLRSRARLPRPFTVPLPVPEVATPVRRAADADHYAMRVRPADVEILPGHTTTIWGYDGRFPGPTIRARSGRRVVVRQHNELPVPLVTHLHGGRTPPPSDGYPTDLVLPEHGRFPGHDPQARRTRGSREYEFPLRQRAATLWYHDHRMDFTAPQAWRGLAGFFLLRDDEEDRLPLPGGDRDIPLLICDRAFEADGVLRYPSIDSSLAGRPGVTEA